MSSDSARNNFCEFPINERGTYMKTKENMRDMYDRDRQHPVRRRNNFRADYYSEGNASNDNNPAEYPSADQYNRQHDYGGWGNSNFTQNTPNRELGRVNARFDRFHSRLGSRGPRPADQRYDLS